MPANSLGVCVSWARPDAISIYGMDYGMGLALDSKTPVRRDGRADECDGLENRWVISPVGSNPTPSAVVMITTFALINCCFWCPIAPWPNDSHSNLHRTLSPVAGSHGLRAKTPTTDRAT